ncbi:MAG: alpha/beta hydrolase [Synergistaceae bacterium]|nr:alpha/beta hydrolase [Synergistaceae bacterium]
MKYSRVSVSGLNIFYREAGDPDSPAILLLHGFPSASHMFRDLMPMLQDKFHLIAPDFPGFGQSDMPSRDEFTYTFDNIADVVDGFIAAIGLGRFSMYVFDYGAPVGFRVALKCPDRITAIISQNGNVYAEGLGKKWEARAEYWKNPTPELRESYKSAFAPETIIGQYTFGTKPGSVSPDGYTLDIHYTGRPGYDEIQSDLILDYRSNVAMYPKFQEYLRTYKPRLLAVWGKNDPSFIPAGAEAFRRDVPDAVIHFVDSGHFALESCCEEIAETIRNFLP